MHGLAVQEPAAFKVSLPDDPDEEEEQVKFGAA
jgi:hypothetical protein